jgi:hypothetical protein
MIKTRTRKFSSEIEAFLTFEPTILNLKFENDIYKKFLKYEEQNIVFI